MRAWYPIAILFLSLDWTYSLRLVFCLIQIVRRLFIFFHSFGCFYLFRLYTVCVPVPSSRTGRVGWLTMTSYKTSSPRKSRSKTWLRWARNIPSSHNSPVLLRWRKETRWNIDFLCHRHYLPECLKYELLYPL